MQKAYVVGICGGSASGKTTLAHELASLLGIDRTNFLSLDDYYIDFVSQGLDPAMINYDHPNSIDIAQLVSDLRVLIEGQSVNIPVYDFSTHTRNKTQRILIPRPFVIIEGLFLFNIAMLAPFFNVKIYVNTLEEIRIHRRMNRDIRDRNRTAESVNKQYHEFVRPMHIEFVQPNLKLADIVIDGNRAFKDQIPEIMKLFD
jgi:uridine kinase